MKKVDALSYEQPSTANNKHTNMAPNEPARPIFGRKWPKVPIMILYFDIWGQKSIYVLSTEHIIVTTGLQLSPLYPPPKKIPFPRYRSFTVAHPEFWPFLGSGATEFWSEINETRITLQFPNLTPLAKKSAK